MMWLLYELCFVIGFIFYLPGAFWRKRVPHQGWSMRLGRYPAPVIERLRGRQTLWVHAVSVGEVLAAQPLLRAFEQTFPDNILALSTITPGGFELASKCVGDRGAAIYFPLDLRSCISRALDVIHPRLLVLMESELWPMVIRLAKARGVPVAVVNGRISPRAFRRYGWIKPWLGGLFNRVDLFLMQSQVDADRLIALGAPRNNIHVIGSLKWDASLGLRPSLQALESAKTRLGLTRQEPLLVAGSTHRGEEAVVLKAFHALRASRQDLRLIIAPRHLERLAEVEELARHSGLKVVRVSQSTISEGWAVGLVDTFGQLPLYYGLATIVFIGGSLIPHGGQNPLEAASLGKPVVFGPSMHNFETIAHQLLAHHAARQVASGDELTPLLEELLTSPSDAQAMGHRAQELTERFQGATQRTLDALRPLLGLP